MPTSSVSVPLADAELAANARQAAAVILAHPLALHLTAASLDLLQHLADREPTTLSEPEASRLRRCIDAIVEAEITYSREVPA